MAGMKGMSTDVTDASSMGGDGSSSGTGMIIEIDLMGMMDDDIGMMGVVAIGGAGSKSIKVMGGIQMASSLPG